MEKTEIEIIYRKYFRDVFLYIRALSENESLAEEITQETFLKAMNNIEKFDRPKGYPRMVICNCEEHILPLLQTKQNLCGRRIFGDNTGFHAGCIPCGIQIRLCRMRQFRTLNAMQN